MQYIADSPKNFRSAHPVKILVGWVKVLTGLFVSADVRLQKYVNTQWFRLYEITDLLEQRTV